MQIRRRYVTFDQALTECPWLTERWLRRLVAEKRVAFSKPAGSNRLLFDLADLEDLAENGRVEPRTKLSLRSVAARGNS